MNSLIPKRHSNAGSCSIPLPISSEIASHLYQAKIKNMGNAGRNGGEYYTLRPLERAIIQVVRPKLGERIYDGAGGSMGFLCEAFEYWTTHADDRSRS